MNGRRPTLLVSSCGMCVLTNGSDEAQRMLVNRLAKCREGDLPEKE